MNCDNYYFDIIMSECASIDSLCLEYRLLSSKAASGRDIYSVEIVSELNGTVDYKFAFDITSSFDRSKEIFTLLFKNTVTPCTLFDVLENIL